MLLNSIKSIVVALFPLVTFPYATRVLGVNNIGRVNFAESIVNIFALFAALGITQYGQRYGSSIRSNISALSDFASELFTVNVIATFVTFMVLLIAIHFIDTLKDSKIFILIFSLSMICNALGSEWVCVVYEDFLYITLRIIIFYIISIIALFAFVRDEDDLIQYTFVSIIVSVGSGITNFIYGRKRVGLHLTTRIRWKEHLPRCFIFFATALAITLYVNTDKIVIGYACGDYELGLYSVSVKIYKVLGTILTAVAAVSIPRLSALYGQNDKENYQLVASDVYRTMITFTLPCAVGVAFFRKEIIDIVAGEKYGESQSSMFILAITMIALMLSVFWGQCVVLIFQKEKELLVFTLFGAVINLLLNIIFVPQYGQVAAAITTMFSEGLVAVLCIASIRKRVLFLGIRACVIKSVFGCLLILIQSIIMTMVVHDPIICFIISAFLSVILYFMFELVLKNEALMPIFNKMRGLLRNLKGGAERD